MNKEERLKEFIENEWDYERNGDLDPYSLTIDSTQKVYWECKNKCTCGKGKCLYYWTASIKDRLTDKYNCCIVCAEYTYVCRHTGIASKRPELIDEYDDFRNSIGIYGVSLNSNKKYYWKCDACPHGCHRWEASPNARICNNTDCPFCCTNSRKKVCLHESIKFLCPWLVEMWDDEYDMSQFSIGSNYNASWKCTNHRCGCVHRWNAEIYNMVKKENIKSKGCALCCGKACCPHSTILVTHPHIAETFDYEKNTLDIHKLSRGAHDKCYWLCENGHSYESSVLSRTSGNGCFKCKNKTEKIIIDVLSSTYDIITQYTAAWCKNVRELPYDIMLDGQFVIIEVDGGQHFRQISNWSSEKNNIITDTYKCIRALLNGYSVIRVSQEYIYKHKHDLSMWLPKLLECIDLCAESDDAKTYFIGYDNDNLYDEHKKLLNKYLETMSIKELSALTYDDITGSIEK